LGRHRYVRNGRDLFALAVIAAPPSRCSAPTAFFLTAIRDPSTIAEVEEVAAQPGLSQGLAITVFNQQVH
jgi:hypothetical protein